MHRMIPYFLASLLPLAMLPSNGVAQAPSSADTYVSSSSPKANYGVSPILVVQPGTTTFIQFNLSALPAGASVNKATLRLYVDGVITGGSFDVFPVNGAWSETTLTYNTPPPTLGTSATGNKPIAITTSGFDKFLLIDITPLVQGWVNGTIPNNGLALALTSTAGFFSFDAKESVLTGNGPELEIVLNGPAGPQGIHGIPGPAGPNGPQGAQGPQGPAGPQGSAGAAGPQGPQGPQGMKGDTGATGPQGIPGAQGAPGPQGPMGVDGAAGATGPQGPIGPAGLTPQGAWNSTSPYVLNDAVTESGQTWRCKVTDCVAGSDPSAVGNTDWELLAAKGADGAQGPQGAQGLKGDTGAAGVQGAPGPAGPQGPAGATGPAGPMGLSITGPQGPQGPPGRQGDAGPAGAAGPAGLQWLGPWQSGVAYLPNQAVSYNGSSYLAVTGNQAFPPSTIGPWQLLASMGATGLAAPPLPPPDCPNPLTVTISVFSSPSLVGSPVTLLGAFANPNVTQSNPTECLKPATYSWKLNASPPGSVAGFNDLSSPSLSFVPDVPGMYQVMLTVTTTDFQTGSGYLTVFATGCGTYPLNPGVMVVSGNGVVATSSTPLSPSSLGHFKVGTALSFDGTLDLTGAVLVDPNAACSHGSLAYNWSIYALPAGSQAAIYPATAAKPTMTLDAVGTYVLKFILSDSYTSSTVYLSVDAQ